MPLNTPAPVDFALPGSNIPRLGHAEAYQMALVELQKFLELAESLDAAGWSRPTACSLWDVRQMVAHLAGAAEGYLSFKEFKRQNTSPELKRYAAQGLKNIDATNQLQVDDRANRTPAELIAELREIGPKAIYNRHKLPGWLRAVRLPIPLLGFVPVGYLTDLIYTRDMWMHRLDICRATGREMRLAPDHDGRMVALVVRDLALLKGKKLFGQTVTYHLTGPAGGRWLVGNSRGSDATVEMDALDFTLLAAGRLPLKTVLEQNLATITGNNEAGKLALENTYVPF